MSALRNTILRLRESWYTFPDYKRTFNKHGHGEKKYVDFYLDAKTFDYVKSIIVKEKLLQKAQKENYTRLVNEINLMFVSLHDQYYFGEFVWACLDYLHETDYHL